MSNLLYFYGMCGVVKELLLKRYFSKVFSCFNFPQLIFVFPEFYWICNNVGRKFAAMPMYQNQI